MGIREKLNRNPAVAASIAGVIIVVSAIFLWRYLRPESPGAGLPGKHFFIDEDSTDINEAFVDDSAKLPPFEHNGKQAVQAVVFSCDGGKTRQIAYLLKYPDEVRAKIEQAREEAAKKGMTSLGGPEFLQIDALVKRPGGEWVKYSDPRTPELLYPRCPDGTPGLWVTPP